MTEDPPPDPRSTMGDLSLIRQLAEEVLERAVEAAPMQVPYVVTDRTRLTSDELTALAKAVNERVSQASVTIAWPDESGRRITIGPADATAEAAR